MAKRLNAPDFDSGIYVGSNPTTPAKGGSYGVHILHKKIK